MTKKKISQKNKKNNQKIHKIIKIILKRKNNPKERVNLIKK